ncbi:unnamed protein product [Adineta steineri]|uniref:Uncharacterized protein n=1 Tax=Adineta steineri TaxID=433720 RepID=A0A814M7T5_9BILA|nr:unnamed protein product [Adineta steineri]CAF1072948.1 unnamed protein product [Adineta steineri]CAF3920271.1 unnamed protein product [Adineta steineri]CAF4040281.1 unnamed protein product [Adineta steineri]
MKCCDNQSKKYAPPLTDSSQITNISTNTASKEDTTVSFRDIDFQIAGSDFLLQKPSNHKSTMRTTSGNSSILAEESPQLDPQSQDYQQKTHDPMNQQQHLSKTFMSPSPASPAINDLQLMTPIKHTPKMI